MLRGKDCRRKNPIATYPESGNGSWESIPKLLFRIYAGTDLKREKNDSLEDGTGPVWTSKGTLTATQAMYLSSEAIELLASLYQPQ